MTNPAPLALAELLNLVNDVYPDGFLGEYFDAQTGRQQQGSGDSLARFIVAELTENFDPYASRTAQLNEARTSLLNAIDVLNQVVEGLLQQQ